MIIEIDMPDDGSELEELEYIVAKINLERLKGPEPKLPPITMAEYVSNLVIGYFQNRVKNEYIGHAKKLGVEALKEKFGHLLNIRKK